MKHLSLVLSDDHITKTQTTPSTQVDHTSSNHERPTLIISKSTAY